MSDGRPTLGTLVPFKPLQIMIPHAQVVMDIFCEAIEKHRPDQWNGFVERVCAGNTELKDRVTELLTAHTVSDSLIDRPTLMLMFDSTWPGISTTKVKILIKSW